MSGSNKVGQAVTGAKLDWRYFIWFDLQHARCREKEDGDESEPSPESVFEHEAFLVLEAAWHAPELHVW